MVVGFLEFCGLMFECVDLIGCFDVGCFVGLGIVYLVGLMVRFTVGDLWFILVLVVLR